MLRSRDNRYLLMGEAVARRRRRVVVAGFCIALLVSIGLLSFSDQAGRFFAPVRAQVVSLSAPLLSIIRQPFSAVGEAIHRQSDQGLNAADASKLRRRIAELEVWQIRAQELEGKLAELSQLAEVVTGPNLEFVTAEVVGVGGGVGGRMLLISAGAAHGVTIGQPVIDGRGLIGTIADAGPRGARVALLNHRGVRVGVMVGKARVRAQTEGDGGDVLQLLVPDDDRRVREGDVVLTSGDRGALPRGLRVGRVVSGAGGNLVEPFSHGVSAQGYGLRFVSVLRFQPAVKRRSAAARLRNEK